ncbi:7-carboxy-7-deazaguanine synthase QueE [Phyllobacterium phragmitis]|uniref:7-carboxy-7-deazaguanine synthase QueE n=1 Tax=Phyllobacterium phragmitis TaxID=2670329 RepID=UPI001FE1D74E|nr:7-carboxy-7-deazaguanine synthase QueE [Phyllobacterium phragmitis]
MSEDHALIRISEIFGPTIQGEGTLIGVPTVFIRAGGCDYRCSWCDTLYAVDSAFRHQWSPMAVGEIWEMVRELSGNRPILVTLSGGNPAIQPFGPLIKLGHGEGYRFAMETQGSVSADWFAELDHLVLSPKPPSSGMKTDWTAVDACLAAAGAGPDIVLKFVVFDDEDYAFARAASLRYPKLSVCLQPGNHTPPRPDEEEGCVDLSGITDRMLWLVDKTTSDGWFEARVLPQLHVILWGNRRGV